MVAERLIVSTPTADSVQPYSTIVYIGDTPEHFVTACEHALAASQVDGAVRAGKGRPARQVA